MKRQEIKAEKQNINSIFSDFWFVIPEYQRSYVWQEDNINDLLDDLWFAFENKPENEYFLGSLVLKRTNEINFNEFEVLDGQQRLTTFYILLSVLRDVTANEDLKKACRKKIFQQGNEFEGTPERERIKYKIRDRVEDFLKEFIITDDGTLQEEKIANYINTNVSLQNMSKAIETIRKFFAAKLPKEIEKFGKYVSLSPVLIYVSTESREDAFRMFTILNNRGVPLTSADILKSMNVGAIADNKEREKQAQIWEKIEGNFGDDFDRFLSFLRTILVKEKARVNLLEEFEENIYKKKKLELGKPTISMLSKYELLYSNLIRLNETFVIENEYKNLISIMTIGLPSGDWIPPLLYFYDKFGKEHILTFLKKLEYKFSSDWILQETPTQRIDNMNTILAAIGNSSTAEEVLNNNDLFNINKESLLYTLEGDIYGRRFARYILLKYEYLLGDNTVHLSDYTTISVEHILPQNPEDSSQWCKVFTEQERISLTNKIGNLCLISMRKNSSLGNLDFKEKKERYLEKRIDVFKGSSVFIKKEDSWTPESIKERQKGMLKLLV